ncbi:MAG: hypothetical protein RRY95_01140 [Oscillospiraceae bacterium]
MRFTNETGLLQALKYSAQRLSRMLTMSVSNTYRRLRRLLNPNGFTTRVMGDVRKGTKELMGGKLQSLKDYIAIGNYYIAKKLAFVLVLVLILAPVLYLKFLHPILRTQLLTTTMVVNSGEMIGYTGKVKLLSAENGTVLYQGPLSQGRVTGKGSLYDYTGKLLYQGDFLMEQYEGSGQTFYPGGKPCYTGAFAANQYEGRGTLRSENGRILYDGNFSAGQYSGGGLLYDGTGALLYAGSFANGLYEGEGTLYQNGSILYQGTFQRGQMEGAGKLYSGKRVIYDGGFADGKFGGSGKEYDAATGKLIYDGNYIGGQYEGDGRLFDVSTGAPIYEGSFYQGVYEGSGKLYQGELPLYEGGFRAGRYDGEGTEYDETLGTPRYIGGFLLGLRHGTGTEYDPATGFVTAAGEYRNGELVVLNPDGTLAGEATAPTVPEDGATTDNPPVPEEKPTPGEGSDLPKPGGKPETKPETKPQEPAVGAKIYQGPKTAAGGIDYRALAALDEKKIQQSFSAKPTAWKLPSGNVMVYADQTEHIGMTVRTDGKGKTVGVDVWNDAEIAGVHAGMSKSAMTAALGAPVSTTKQTVGTDRMISISQSNRFFGRMTNLSPESQVTALTYQTKDGTVQAIFAGNDCLLLEILP